MPIFCLPQTCILEADNLTLQIHSWATCLKRNSLLTLAYALLDEDETTPDFRCMVLPEQRKRALPTYNKGMDVQDSGRVLWSECVFHNTPIHMSKLGPH